MKTESNPFVVKHQYGILLKRGIPVTDFVTVGQQLPKGAVLNAGIASHYDMAACMGMPDDLAKWEAEIADEIATLPKERQYLEGTDWGISSMTVFAALAQNPINRQTAERKLGSFGPDLPADPADFGRCHRLLLQFPGWKERLPEVAKAYPNTKWKHLVPKWEELTKLYEEEQHKAVHEQLNKINRDPEIS